MVRLTFLVVMQENYAKGPHYSKIGAKSTGCYQPMEVGPFFKIIKSCNRMCTSKKSISPLINTIEDGLTIFLSSGKLLLPPKKKDTIVDFSATAPEVREKVF